MSRDTRRRTAAWAGLALGTSLLSACSSPSPAPVTTDPWVEGGLPEYCGGRGGDLAQFWTLVHASCSVAQDGDAVQSEVLDGLLAELPDERVDDFRRTFLRLNRELEPIAQVADEICAPGLGLGQDLGHDYRSWVIAHGQAAYEAVLADPDRLRDFPDATAGCGLGELFGAVADGTGRA